jgi:tetratricopeptide (TPR) repeat protein
VIALALLLAQDLMLRRKPDFTVLAGCTAVALGAAVLHIWVSRRVGMMASFPGGTRSTALITMGPVWLRYMGLLIWPGGLSAFHDAAVLTRWNLAAAAGYTALAGWLWLGTHWWRKRKDPLVLAAWAWFAIPLLPVSHFLFPLQNLMADRYLLLSVMGLALLVAPLARHRVGMLAVITFVTVLALATAHRNALFADSVLLFRDATAKTKTSADAPYQLGQALETAGESRRAQAAYEEALKRAEMRSEVGRRATNSLASLYARSGALGQALSVLERGRKQWPDDPDMLTNLAVVHGALGQTDQARALYRELVARFPDYVAKREAELRSEAARGAPQ